MKIKRSSIINIAITILLLVSPEHGRAQSVNAVSNLEVPTPAEVTPKPVKTTLDVLEVKDMDIYEVLKRIAFQSGLEIITDEAIEARVTIYLKSINVFEALRIILDSQDLAYSQEGSTVHVMRAQTFQGRFGYPFNQKIQTRIIPLKHAQPQTVEVILNRIKTFAGKVIYSEETKSFILLETPAKIAAMSELLERIDVPVEARTFQLHHSKPKDMAQRMEDLLTQDLGKIEFGEDQKSLTVTDTAAKLSEIAKYIEESDKPAKEVLLEVKILQIILNDENRQGVDWEAIVSDFKSLKFAGFGDQPAAAAGAPADKAGTLSVGTVSEEDYMVLLDALDTVGMLNTVSNLRMSNSEGRNEILIRSQDLLADVAPQSVKEGATAKGEVLYSVLSQLGPEGQIELTLRPQLLDNSAGEKLTMNLQDGTTVVIGGLFKKVSVEATHKIPLLGDLPLVGFAFRMQGQRARETEIIVFLTPKIIEKE